MANARRASFGPQNSRDFCDPGRWKLTENGYALPQQAPKVFADAVIEVTKQAGWGRETRRLAKVAER